MDLAADDGDSEDIDMELLGEGFNERQHAFQAAAAELQAAKGGPQEALDAAKRKYLAAAEGVGLGAKRARRGS